MPSNLLKKQPVESSSLEEVPHSSTMVEFDFDAESILIDINTPLMIIDKTDEVPDSPEPPTPESVDQGGQVASTSGKSGKQWKKVKKAGKDARKKTIDQGRQKTDEEILANLPQPVFRIIPDYKEREGVPRPKTYIRYIDKTPEELYEQIEYDMGEEDMFWLQMYNEDRAKERRPPVSFDTFEFVIDRLEKESYFQMESSGTEQGPMIDDDAVCCICMDGECQNSNAILFCDMCNLAVHQECYGVPYIPEGQWLCRRCFLCPSFAVDCVLCPNKGGAFKQTQCNQWAHVSCAIWIPEVCFANTVFLEPIDNISSIPQARWKLCCFICKQKNAGACIQCYKSNCYTAFHVTCAQQAGLCMRMETVKSSCPGGFEVKKTAFCHAHAPPDFLAERDSESPTARLKMKRIRKMLADRRRAVPVVSVPTIPAEKIEMIMNEANIKKKEFIRRLVAYWKLKRLHRGGVPLLRRLQVTRSSRTLAATQVVGMLEGLGDLTQLRQQLEKGRLLCELTRKREKTKREEIYVACAEWDMRIQPFNYFMASIVDEIISRDTQSIFTQPVDPEHVPDYLTIVTNPMDLATMKKKIFDFAYNSIEDLERDFQLMIENCLLYNSSDTVFYRIAKRIQELGGIVFREAKRQYEKLGFENGGIMSEQAPPEYKTSDKIDDNQLAAEIDKVLEDTERNELDLEQHLNLLNQTMDKCLSLSHPLSRKTKFLKVKYEIIRLKRKKKSEEVEKKRSRVSEVRGGSAREVYSSMEEDESEEVTSRLRGGNARLSEGTNKGRNSAGDERSGAKKNNILNIRRRLRSTEVEAHDQPELRQQQLPQTLRRRQSRSTSNVSVIAGQQPGPSTSSYPSDRPRRGRPPKSLTTLRGRGRGGSGFTSNRSAAISTGLRQRGFPSSRRGVGFRGGRGRGRRLTRRPVRRSDRVSRMQEMLAQQASSTSPDKEVRESRSKSSSRQGSPLGRHTSPRLLSRSSSSRQGSPLRSPQRRSTPVRQQSPTRGAVVKPPQIQMVATKQARLVTGRQDQIIGHHYSQVSPGKSLQMHMLAKRPANVGGITSTVAVAAIDSSTGRAVKLGGLVSPTSMEDAAKSIVCNDKHANNKHVGKVMKGKLLLKRGRPSKEMKAKLALLIPNNSNVVIKGRKLRNTGGTGHVPNRVLPQRKVRGPAAAVGKRKKPVVSPDITAMSNPSNGPITYLSSNNLVNVKRDSSPHRKKSLVPLSNGLPVKSPVFAGEKHATPHGKFRVKRSVPAGATSSPPRHPHGVNNAVISSGSLSNNNAFSAAIYHHHHHHHPAGLHLRRADSFSVYRSGGDIETSSEGESGSEDDDEIEENEDVTGSDEDDETEEPEKRDEDDNEDASSDDDDEEEEADGHEDDDESSDSDDSSGSDSDSSDSSSSDYSSSSSSSASDSKSSSTITAPKHSHPIKNNNKKRRSSGNRNNGTSLNNVKGLTHVTQSDYAKGEDIDESLLVSLTSATNRVIPVTDANSLEGSLLSKNSKTKCDKKENPVQSRPSVSPSRRRSPQRHPATLSGPYTSQPQTLNSSDVSMPQLLNQIKKRRSSQERNRSRENRLRRANASSNQSNSPSPNRTIAKTIKKNEEDEEIASDVQASCSSNQSNEKKGTIKAKKRRTSGDLNRSRQRILSGNGNIHAASSPGKIASKVLTPPQVVTLQDSDDTDSSLNMNTSPSNNNNNNDELCNNKEKDLQQSPSPVKSSASSDITAPRHFHQPKARRRLSSGDRNRSRQIRLSGVTAVASTAGPRRVGSDSDSDSEDGSQAPSMIRTVPQKQRVGSHSLVKVNNNNNVLCRNKEIELVQLSDSEGIRSGVGGACDASAGNDSPPAAPL